MSKRASSEILEPLGNFSPVSGCNIGSVDTSVEISSNKHANVSRRLLWRLWIKPPFMHETA